MIIRTLLTLAAAFALTACGEGTTPDAAAPETIARHIETTDCAGETRVVERVGLRIVDGARHHDLRVDGVAYALVTDATDDVTLLEVLQQDTSLALAEVTDAESRILAPDGRVFVSEGGAGFAEALHEAITADASLLLKGEVVAALAPDADLAAGLEIRTQGLDNDNLGTCNGVTCSSKDTNESCCCKSKCVRNDTRCWCESATQARTLAGGGGVFIGGIAR
jgi:hypothetical protein